MRDRRFLDTNVFVYAATNQDRNKQTIAREIIKECLASGSGVTSQQVAQEWLNAVIKYNRKPLTVPDLMVMLDTSILPMTEVWATRELFQSALHVHFRWGFSFYDSMIVAAARTARATELITEDLQHGQDLGGLVVVNPFL